MCVNFLLNQYNPTKNTQKKFLSLSFSNPCWTTITLLLLLLHLLLMLLKMGSPVTKEKEDQQALQVNINTTTTHTYTYTDPPTSLIKLCFFDDSELGFGWFWIYCIDPDAEVVSLSPKTLLESDRYVCEICNQGFQRDQNLQMHRRRHKVPWKLLKRETQEVKKRVFVCPEPSCLHHDPCHALGDLVGIKKHFRRKHSNHKQWVCDKCSKGYAVQSDYKAHLKTCGTRGHSCDCGRVFSRFCSFHNSQFL